MVGVIDEKHNFRNVMFLTKFSQKFLRQWRCCRKQLYMKEFVRFRNDCGVQLILLTIDPDIVCIDFHPVDIDYRYFPTGVISGIESPS
jgi:hypothetical protein